jgi:hypothetical protein
MRYFDNFPEERKCPVCGTNKNGKCFLIPIDGTESGGNVEATPIHAECIGERIMPNLRYNKNVGILYFWEHDGVKLNTSL